MTNIIVQEGQSIFDIVIQHYGSLDFLVQFCFDNKIGIDTDLTAGQVVVVDETIGVKSIKEFFKLNALSANNRQWKEEVVLSDLDILRQIRDANPDSQLPTLWLDSEDPYTQWEGARFNGDFVDHLSIYSRGINVMPNVNRLKKLLRLDCYYNAIPNLNLESMPSLLILVAHDNNIEEINLQGSGNIQAIRVENNFIQSLNLAGKRNLSIINASNNRLQYIDVQGASGITKFLISHNKLASVPSLAARGAIVDYDFRYNNFATTELDRFRAMGFTDESKLLPQNP